MCDSPFDSRRAVLDERCGTDPELRRLVDDLLVEDAAAVTNSSGGSPIRTAPALGVPGAPGGVGGRIGRYRLVRLVGEGGMGVVYEAEQDSPRRTVAVKLIRPGFGTPDVLRRFEHESEVLGRLQHPGIAQIHEAGREDTGGGGSPYFVMELIRGAPLLRYAAERGLTIRGRVELVAKIADAVQHAHQKGVIHRDLKPSNVLVDDAGQPKILDFGIARVLGDEGGGAGAGGRGTVYTSAGQLVGTVPYMSPEQAAGDPAAIDVRTDVYALGVMLFELLTGRLPYDVSTATLQEALRIVRETEPVRPGTLDRRLRGDLETITLRALEKEPARRYQSAAELGADLRRHLRDEPILARPATTLYQWRKFARRHRALVGAVGAVFGVLLSASVVSSVFAVRAARAWAAEKGAREAAEKRRVVAERQTMIAREVNDFLNDDLLGSINPSRGNPHDVTVREAVDAAAARIEGRFPDQPVVEAEIRSTLGQTYASLGAFEAGEPHALKAVEMLTAELGPDDELTLTAKNRLGNLYRGWSRYDLAEPLGRETLEGRLRVLGERDPLTLSSMFNLAGLLREMGRLDEALALFERGYPMAREVIAADETQLQDALNSMAGLYKDLERYAEASAMYEEMLERQRRLRGPGHPATLATMNNLAVVCARTGQFERAEALYREALEAQERQLTERHPQVLASMTNLAKLYARMERHAEAEALYTRALGLSREVLGEGHRGTVITTLGLAALYVQSDRPALAAPLLEEAVTKSRETLGEDHVTTIFATNDFAKFCTRNGRVPEAVELSGRAVAAAKRALPASHPEFPTVLINHGAALVAAGRFEEAEQVLTEADSLLAAGTSPAQVAVVHDLLVRARARGGAAQGPP